MDEDDGLKLGGKVIVIEQSQTTQCRARDKFKVFEDPPDLVLSSVNF